ncbi:hypothetical protein CR513_32953, partial [Mucuna pruriens]
MIKAEVPHSGGRRTSRANHKRTRRTTLRNDDVDEHSLGLKMDDILFPCLAPMHSLHMNHLTTKKL